jgi:prevent-host-death family protein
MKVKHIGVFEAKTRLSEVLDRVQRGEVYIISKRGRPVAELRPVPPAAGLEFGCDAGLITIGEDFDLPVPGLKEYTE